MKVIVWIHCLMVTTGLASLHEKVVGHYGTVIHATYAEALSEAKRLEEMVGRFVDDPTAEKMEALKKQWVLSRYPYSQSEVTRFYGGPIDDENGFEGWINAWPIDEAYLDYVRGKPDAGIINQPGVVRGVNEETLFELNEQGGEADICTGYHAIEFLLWGQDFYPDSPGRREVSDYTTHRHAKRRRDALQACARLLVTHLSNLEADWSAGKTNYRQNFENAPAKESLEKILTGMVMLAGFEIASERLAVAYETQNQEDEHSCFSDTTHLDLIHNIQGIENVWSGRYRTIEGPGMRELARAADQALAEKISRGLTECLKRARAIPVPFDQAVLGDDDAPGRVRILACIEGLESLREDLLLLAEKADLDLELQ
jgi:putative iron-regulated protein